MERKNDRLLPYNILAIQRFLQSVPGCQKAAEVRKIEKNVEKGVKMTILLRYFLPGRKLVFQLSQEEMSSGGKRTAFSF